MKINLLLNSTDIRGGYINIDPFAQAEDSERIRGNLANLDEHVDDSEATDILALDIIDFMSSVDTNDILASWLRKLRRSGTISVGGVDIREVAHALVHQRIGLTEANLLLYGEQRAPWEYRRATLTIQHMIKGLQDQGMKIERKQINGYHYLVTARRP